MKIFINTLILICVFQVKICSQTNTEIFVFDFLKTKNGFIISNPINISNNDGYDSQPHFTKDSNEVLFSSNNKGQTDLVRYSLLTNQKTVLLNTPASEYSPTPIPNIDAISYIKLEADGTQLLWKLDLTKQKEAVLIPNLKIGYHVWTQENDIVSFVLGNPQTLQYTNLKTNQTRVIDSLIGRSLHKIPTTNLISYISKLSDIWCINSFNPVTMSIKKIIDLPFNVEDITWTPDGSVIVAHKSTFYLFDSTLAAQWIEIKDTENFTMLQNITRISVSPNGKKLAVVISDK